MTPIRVVIAGGGTGGHLYPGIAVARELQRRKPDTAVSFAGTAKGIEARGYRAKESARSGDATPEGQVPAPAKGMSLLRGGVEPGNRSRGGECRIGVGGYSSGPGCWRPRCAAFHDALEQNGYRCQNGARRWSARG